MNEKYISVKRASELISVTPHYIRKLLREGKINGKQDTNSSRWSVEKSSLEKFKNTDFYVQTLESLRKPQNISIKDAVVNAEEYFETDLISYISFPGSPVSYIDQNDCVLLDDLLYSLEPFEKGINGKRFKRITLFLHSSGGIMEASIKFVNIIRQYANEYNVIVPMFAKSAATLMALMADKLYFTTLSELGPVDPMVQNPARPEVMVPATAIGNFYKYSNQISKRNKSTDFEIDEPDPIFIKKLEESLDPYLLGAYENSLEFSKQEVRKALKEHAMRDANSDLLEQAVNKFTIEHKSHSYPIMSSELEPFNIGERIDDNGLRSVKILMGIYQQFMNSSNIVKVIGNREENKNIQLLPVNPSQQVPTKTQVPTRTSI